ICSDGSVAVSCSSWVWIAANSAECLRTSGRPRPAVRHIASACRANTPGRRPAHPTSTSDCSGIRSAQSTSSFALTKASRTGPAHLAYSEPEWSRAGCCTHRTTDGLPRRAAAGGPAVGPSARTPGLLTATDPCSAPIPGRCCRPPAVGCARTSVGVPVCTANMGRTAWIGWYAARAPHGQGRSTPQPAARRLGRLEPATPSRRLTFGLRDVLSWPTGRTVMPMTARCASATNPVEPGTASVIPPRKGYARLTRIEFETIYSAADAAWEPPTPRVNQSLGSPAVLIDLVLVKGRGRSVWVGLRVAPELANADLEQGHVVVHLAVGAPVQHRHPLPQLSL